MITKFCKDFSLIMNYPTCRLILSLASGQGCPLKEDFMASYQLHAPHCYNDIYQEYHVLTTG